ncbi:MAG TPA: hypothetical protein VE825_03080 [Terriglobales bacterium]|nr:hypothetical protein [Terriglobales bacterium]
MKRVLVRWFGVMAVVAALAASLGAQQAEKAAPAKKVSPLEAQEFSEAVGEAALAGLRAGFQGHNADQVMSLFERGRLTGWSDMRERLENRMASYDSFRMGYHLVSATAEGGRGTVVAEVELESVAQTQTGVTSPEHRSATLRLTLERGPKGWRIVDYSPRGFFTQ